MKLNHHALTKSLECLTSAKNNFFRLKSGKLILQINRSLTGCLRRKHTHHFIDMRATASLRHYLVLKP